MKIHSKIKRESPESRNEQRRFNALLEDYSVSLSDYDVDHIKDLSWGGDDVVSNLWPLCKDLNRKWGNYVYNQVATFKDKDGNARVSTPKI